MKAYTDLYNQAWVVTTFMDNMSGDFVETPAEIKRVRAGLRHFFNEQHARGSIELWSNMQGDFKTFLRSNDADRVAYQKAIKSWIDFANPWFPKHVSDDIESLNRNFDIRHFRYPDNSIPSIYVATGVMSVGLVSLTVAVIKEAINQYVASGLLVGAVVVFFAYVVYYSQDKITPRVKAMKAAPLDTHHHADKPVVTTTSFLSRFSTGNTITQRERTLAAAELNHHVNRIPQV